MIMDQNLDQKRFLKKKNLKIFVHLTLYVTSFLTVMTIFDILVDFNFFLGSIYNEFITANEQWYGQQSKFHAW